MEPKRLNKYISDSGFCSRREADKLIEQGRVTVNGKLPEPGTQITDKDKVRIDDQTLTVRHEPTVFLLFNKPIGIATTTNLTVRNNIIQALNYPAALLPIGFLDREAEGLMFLSNDTELVNRMTKGDNKFEKEYLVTVDKFITPDFLTKISEGSFPTAGASRAKNFVKKEGTNRFRIVLEPGTNHHLKKLVEDSGYRVVHLNRVRVADFTPGNLAIGMWRVMTEAEVQSLKSILSGKIKTASTGKDDFINYQDDDLLSSKEASSRPKAAPGRAARITSSRGINAKAVPNFNPKSKELRGGRKKSSTGGSPGSRGNAPSKGRDRGKGPSKGKR
ncbi:pseudouridine synthase [Adhaeribacter aquaticus]|uniref:pseudouridine synthase n=1 Tax=Adhaeribacter aquaticus TaxID=299567 RepID=UPI0004053714|nr:S4 domain-containing protein [Adhaeribacter aquaticus]